jgi:Ca2+-binding RTX toxin-like protein
MPVYEQDYAQLSQEEQLAKLLERGFDRTLLMNIVDVDSNPNLPGGGLGYDYKALLELTDKAVNLTPDSISALAFGGRIHSNILRNIGSSSELVNHLNLFVGTYDGHESRFSIGGDTAAAYDPKADLINFGTTKMQEWATAKKNGESEKMLAAEAEIIGRLAHELAHSRERAAVEQLFAANTNTYAEHFDGSRRLEGAGLYWQYMTIKEIYNSGSEKQYENMDIDGYWEKGADKAASANLYTKISTIIANYGTFDESNPPDDLIYQIGIMGGQMTSPIHLDPNVSLTYDEWRRWDWMSIHTDFAIDYLEARGIIVSGKDENEKRKAAAIAIRGSKEYSWDIKVLLNHYNNYLGNPEADTVDNLSAEAGGSALGRTGGREVLWGGGGDDTLRGSNIQDILLGGDGNDRLFGNNGNDILAGNKGINQLSGGTGDDRYTIGQGHYDIISDVNENGVKRGEVYLDNDENTKLTGGTATNNYGAGINFTTYYSADKRFVYTHFSDNPGNAGRLVIEADGKIVAEISDFKNGDLDITLNAAPPKEAPVIDGQLNLDNVYNYLAREEGQDSSIKIKGGNKADVLFGGRAAETIEGNGNDDYIIALAGNDHIYGGDGNDYIVGGFTPFSTLNYSPSSSSSLERDGVYVDNDYLVGGIGQDMIMSGQGDDIIITGTSSGETGIANGAGDWAAGGDDMILGQVGDDILDDGSDETVLLAENLWPAMAA